MAEITNIGPNILVGVTGSVAAIKTLAICKEILAKMQNANIKICITKSGKHFVQLFGMNEIDNELRISVYDDETEWSSWSKRGDEVVHIALRKWADILVIAPLSANTLAKLANGMSDNLLTSVFRAWDFDVKHVILAPAMNTLMWHNAFTQKHLSSLQQLFNGKIHIVEPISKKLMCNDVGKGAMATPSTIVQCVRRILRHQSEFENPVRILSKAPIDSRLMTFGIIVFVAFAVSIGKKKNNT